MKTHNEQNIKISNEDSLRITDFSFASGGPRRPWGHVASGEPQAAVRAATMGADVLSSKSRQTQRLHPAGFYYLSAQKQARK